MRPTRPLAAALLLALGLPGCVVYEYEHEFWLRADGSGTVHVTGRPGLWTAFKGLGASGRPPTPEAARALFERSGLRVLRARTTRRGGASYLFVAADFDDVNRLLGTPAFPDLRLALKPEGGRLTLAGTWSRPAGAGDAPASDREGLMCVRFHLPSKVYEHRNAFAGVERGNIVGWRQQVRLALEGRALEVGATLDARSILWSTVALFVAAIATALLLLGGALYLVARQGRKGA